MTTPQFQPPPRQVKVVLLGDAGVGKTTLARQFGISSPASPNIEAEYQPTPGPELLVKQLVVNGVSMRIQLWDASGKDLSESPRVRSAVLEDVNAVFIMYDVTNEESFASLDSWVRLLEIHASPEVLVMLVGNKVDAPERVVTWEHGKAYSEALRIPFQEYSVKRLEDPVHLLSSLLAESSLGHLPFANEIGAKTSRDHSAESLDTLEKLQSSLLDSGEITAADGESLVARARQRKLMLMQQLEILSKVDAERQNALAAKREQDSAAKPESETCSMHGSPVVESRMTTGPSVDSSNKQSGVEACTNADKDDLEAQTEQNIGTQATSMSLTLTKTSGLLDLSSMTSDMTSEMPNSGRCPSSKMASPIPRCTRSPRTTVARRATVLRGSMCKASRQDSSSGLDDSTMVRCRLAREQAYPSAGVFSRDIHRCGMRARLAPVLRGQRASEASGRSNVGYRNRALSPVHFATGDERATTLSGKAARPSQLISDPQLSQGHRQDFSQPYHSSMPLGMRLANYSPPPACNSQGQRLQANPLLSRTSPDAERRCIAAGLSPSRSPIVTTSQFSPQGQKPGSVTPMRRQCYSPPRPKILGSPTGPNGFSPLGSQPLPAFPYQTEAAGLTTYQSRVGTSVVSRPQDMGCIMQPHLQSHSPTSLARLAY